MKPYFFTPFVMLIAASVISCGKETVHGPKKYDSEPPGLLTDIRVTKKPGGASIFYSPPGDKDLLYVEAKFDRYGKQVALRASPFANHIDIEGLNDTLKHSVHLHSVDNSGNASKAQNVTIKPGIPPIWEVDLKLVSSTRGIYVTFKNDTGSALVIYTMKENQTLGRKITINTHYTDLTKGYYNVNVSDSLTAKYMVFAKDRWDNLSDTVSAVLRVVPEQEVPKPFRWVKMPQDPPFSRDFWRRMETPNRIWDGVTFLNCRTEKGAITSRTEMYKYRDVHMITFDLLAKVKLSRFKLWHYYDFRHPISQAYNSGNPRVFDLWGAVEAPSITGSFDRWFPIVRNAEVIKPSRLPEGEVTDEDLKRYVDGFEFEVPPDVPSVRYIRFVLLENWEGNATWLSISEMNFYGQIISDYSE